MSRLGSATAMAGAALLALLSLDACDGQRPEASAPPPVASTPPPATTPDLMGGPPEHAAPPAASEQPADEQAFTPMAPVANPEDMAPRERAQVYGHGYDRPNMAGETRYAGRRHRVHAVVGHGRRASFGLAEHRRLAWRGHWRRFTHGLQLHHATGVQLAATSPANHEPTKSAGPETAPSAASASGVPSSPSADLGSSNQDWLSIPGAPYVDWPGLGRVPSRYITAIILLLLAVALLAIAAGRGRVAGRGRRTARNAVGAEAAFSGDRPASRAPSPGDAGVAPFPHLEGSFHSESTRN